MSKQISKYRLRRLEQQQQMVRLQEVEAKEKFEMESALARERQAYETTKFQLYELKEKVKRLKKRNRKE
jgi:hypothetical protein